MPPNLPVGVHARTRTRRYLTREVDWENEISYGERQRLAIARLVYNSPRFAILDECTSAVTREMEQRLYAYCNGHGISYITIAHRPALQVLHARHCVH